MPARLLRLASAVLLCFLTASVSATLRSTAFLFRQPDASSPPAPKPGWEKVELTRGDRTGAPIPLSAVTSAGAEDVADYGTYRIVYVPADGVKALTARLAEEGIRVRERDDLDRIDTPGARIDARLGIDPSTPVSGLTREYPPKTNGLYLLQLAGPAKAEWYKTLLDLGWSVIRYIPSDAYVVVGPPELVPQTRLLPFVQFFDFYHPFQKGATHAGDGKAQPFLFVIPSIEGKKQAIDTIGALAAPDSLRVESYANDTYVHALMKESDANSLLATPLVIGVSIESELRMSDERQAMSLSGNVTAAGSQPTSPTTYASWLASHCSQCTAANMPSDIKFDDDPITPFVTPVRAHHTEQLRQAIDSIRIAAGFLTATNWLDGTSLHGVVVKSQHVTQMQSQLDAALAQLGLVSSPYTPLAARIKAQDINELRAHVK